jgi:hypothetical protein
MQSLNAQDDAEVADSCMFTLRGDRERLLARDFLKLDRLGGYAWLHTDIWRTLFGSLRQTDLDTFSG